MHRRFCRFCDGSLELVLDLGFTPLADRFLTSEQLNQPEATYPLRLCRCTECSLLQIDFVVEAERLYDESYVYDCAITDTSKRYWRSFAAEVWKQENLHPGAVVVDIGSNTGELLLAFKELGAVVQGVDPAPIPADRARERGVPTISGFFGKDAAAAIRRDLGAVDLVCSTNVFAHIDDSAGLTAHVGSVLKDTGAWIIEAPAATKLVERLEYDTIYHEHLSYLAASPMKRFFARQGFSLVDACPTDYHGGSLRYTIRAGVQRESERLTETLRDENRNGGISDPARLARFAERVHANRLALKALVGDLVSRGERIAAIGAPAKGMTLLHACGLGTDEIAFVTERAPDKIGKFTPGSHIPILDDDALLERRPSHALMLSWNFQREIFQRLKPFRAAGGRFILPLLEPHILGGDHAH